MIKSVLFVLALLPGMVCGQTAVELVQNLQTRADAPAAGVAILKDGMGDIAVTGVTRQGGESPVSGAAPWHLGSNTKSMTALVVALLVDQGVLSWDDTVGDILGPVLPQIHPDLAPATYLTLLSHRSGLPPNAPTRLLRRLAGARSDVVQDRLDYAAAVLAADPAQPPGTFGYSNAGYVVAGAMLEATTGTPWETLIRQHIFKPLDLESAGFGAPEGEGVPWGHRQGLLGMRGVAPGPKADNVPAMGPAGRVHMSLADYLDYLALTATRPTTWLPQDTWDVLHRPPDEVAPYALGWTVAPDGALSHDGSNTLWYARATVWPGRGAAAFVVNRGEATDAMTALSDRLGAP